MAGSSSPERRANHLAGESSPYLRQHLYNPVDWYPWGDEARAKAAREDKPIFLSIGYAACHWCHVMERESFESEAIAAKLNAWFVAIKVDREERPDVDEIYMTAVQMMTGQGGWPLSVFLTPDAKPFFGGTYFPPEDAMGRAGFGRILDLVHEAWVERRAEIAGAAEGMTARIREGAEALPEAAVESAPAGPREAALAAADLAARFDPRWGGFGPPPKFPPHGAIGLLLREHARGGESVPLRMAVATLDRMATGGMYDQIGGGFARYSVDERWLVPHFEKMLYDQALLVPAYLDGWLVTGAPLYRRVVEETLDFVKRELGDPAGGFRSSIDADSEGHEGAFYVWTAAEVDALLGTKDGPFFRSMYGIEDGGNFEGKSIPNLLGGSWSERAAALGVDEAALGARLAPMRRVLLEARERRPRPATDDKVLTAWNGLAISAFARAHQAFERPEDLEAARDAARFVRTEMARDGRLLAAWGGGRARLNAYLDDYAFVARGLIDLYETAFDPDDLALAGELLRRAVERFAAGPGRWHFTSDDHEALVARTQSAWDGALPSGAGVLAEALLRAGRHLDDAALTRAGRETLAAFRDLVARAPSAFASLLAASAFDAPAACDVAIVGGAGDPRTHALVRAAHEHYAPGRAIARGEPGDSSPAALLAGKEPAGGVPTAYVCRRGACGPPARRAEELAAQLAARR